jgi:predicted ester cyclase
MKAMSPWSINTALRFVDHQELPGPNHIEHIKEVILAMRTAFPDLHFEIHDAVAEGDIVAFRSTMTGTQTGVFNVGPVRGFPPTGKSVSVSHMHFLRVVDEKVTDLWHVWDIPALMRQLGIMPEPRPQAS